MALKLIQMNKEQQNLDEQLDEEELVRRVLSADIGDPMEDDKTN